jgi:hypothetical protein
MEGKSAKIVERLGGYTILLASYTKKVLLRVKFLLIEHILVIDKPLLGNEVAKEMRRLTVSHFKLSLYRLDG